MKNPKMKILIVGLTALCLSAGVVAGMLVSRLPNSGPSDSSNPNQPPAMATLAEKLNLDADQQSKMKGIWENVRSQVQQSYLQATELEAARDNEIAKMLNDEQKVKFEKIAHDYHEKYLQVSRDRDQVINAAIQRTKKLLNPLQQKQYDQELKMRLGHLPPSAS